MKAKDGIGNPIEVGDIVAYDSGYRGTEFRQAEVVKITSCMVKLDTKYRYRPDLEVKKWDFTKRDHLNVIVITKLIDDDE